VGQGDGLSLHGRGGSFGILQTTPQMIMNLLDHEFSVQAAIEVPRVRAYEATTVEIEARVPKVVRDELIRRGHTIRLIDAWSFLVGGAAPHRDGVSLGF
jgi:gamma-glutamyltranspeptidase / glutathione hydrolase